MSLILDGTNGLSDVDGTAATPAIRGTDTNTGIFFPAADTIAFSEGGVESARFDSSGNFGIGTTSPTVKLDVMTSGGPSIIRNTTYRAAAGQSTYSSQFARGTSSSPTIVLNGDSIGGFEFYPYNGTNFNLQTAAISALVTGTVTSSSIPTSIIFSTDAAGSAFANERMRITSDGTLRQTLNPLSFNIDASPCTATITNGSNINFGFSYSGVIFATDTSSSGETAILSCGGGTTATTGSSQFTNTSGSGNIRFYNSGSGYVLQNNSGGTITFGLFVVRTRAGT